LNKIDNEETIDEIFISKIELTAPNIPKQHNQLRGVILLKTKVISTRLFSNYRILFAHCPKVEEIEQYGFYNCSALR
jgi:hypothetical protein